MENTVRPAGPRWVDFLVQVRARIGAREFCARHWRGYSDFTRQRLLTFPVVTLFLLRKTTRSVQRHLHSFL